MHCNRTHVNPGDGVVVWFSVPVTADVMLQGKTPMVLERLWTYRRPSWYEAWYWQHVRIPKGTPPGQYTLTAGGFSVPLTVKNRPKRPAITAGDIATANQFLMQGYDVTLTPGEYVMTTALYLPPGSTLRGYGATLRGSTQQYQNALIVANDESSIHGVSFHPDDAVICGAKNNAATNVTVNDCTITGGHLGIFSSPGLVVSRCKFRWSGIINLTAGLIAACDFQGIAEGEHSFSTVGHAKVACLQLSFDGTDRGPILRGASDSLFAGVKCRDINDVNNGCEVCCMEGDFPVRRCIFAGWRTTNCPGVFQPFDCEFTDNLCLDFDFHKTSIGLFGLAKQENNTFSAIRLEGGGVFLNHPGYFGAKNNTFSDIGILDWRLRPGNQFSGSKHYYERSDLPGFSPVCDLSATGTNRVKGLTVVNPTPGRPESYGVTLGN